MIWNLDSSAFTSSGNASIGILTGGPQTQLVATITAAYGAGSILKNTLSGTRRDLTFRMGSSPFYFRILMDNTLFQWWIGTGADASGNLLNATEITVGWQRGTMSGYGIYPIYTFAFSESGFIVSMRTPRSIGDGAFVNKFWGVGLLLDAQGNVKADECDVWSGNIGMENQDAEQWQRGEWMTVRRWNVAQLAFLRTVNTRMPFIGFQQFPQGVDTMTSKLYGVKCYSPLSPYEESAMWRTFPGDAFTEGQTVTDDRGKKWVLSDRSSALWRELTYVFPLQIQIYGTRTALAW